MDTMNKPALAVLVASALIYPGTEQRADKAGCEDPHVKRSPSQRKKRRSKRRRNMAEKNSAALTLTLPSDREIVLTRVFDAPRRLVFEARTKPEHVARWWGPRGYTLLVWEIDLRLGGVWRFVQRGPDGNEYAFNGVSREIAPPERLVYTFNFEAMPGHEAPETVTFKEHDGKTKLTDKSLFQTVEDRDGMLKSGMEEGAAETLDHLEELLAKLV
jgi:uncharacterized protein YndB with AHSA1/START domain